MRVDNAILSMNPFTFWTTYDVDENDVKGFLVGPWTVASRQTRALELIKDLLADHGKEQLRAYLVELLRIEAGIKELEPWVRDHGVHALLTYLLGAYVAEEFLRPHQRPSRLQWKLAALLHDVAYPVQVANDLLKPFTGTLNALRDSLGVRAADVSFSVTPNGLCALTDGRSSLDLIQDQIDTWGLNVDAKFEYKRMLDEHRICHGIISALSVLWTVDLMYAKQNPSRTTADVFDSVSVNWSQAYFDADVVPACSSIFLHNLPPRVFTGAKILRDIAPCAFLLKLCDVLQEWERPSKSLPAGEPASKFDLEVSGGTLEYRASIDCNRVARMKSEIQNCLCATDIVVQ